MYMRIETKVKWRIFKKILLLLLLAAGIGYLLWTSFSFCDLWEKIFSVLLSVVVYGYLFFKIKLIPLLRDKTWLGTIHSRQCKKSTVIRGVVARPGNIVDVIVARWKVFRDDGMIEVLPYETEVIADDYFKTGDRVRHFKGAKIIVRANPDEHDENLLCPLCGKMVMKPECSFCRITFDMAPEPMMQNDTDEF